MSDVSVNDEVCAGVFCLLNIRVWAFCENVSIMI